MNGPERPVAAGIAERLSALDPERRRLLARRLGMESGDGASGGRPARIVAFVAPAHGSRLQDPSAAAELREFLRERLPDYMLPSRFVPLAAMPRLPNGKVDREALREPEPAAEPRPVAAAAERRTETADSGALVEVMRGIWREVLQADEVYPEDDFFELGGDSLLSINVVARAREQGVSMKPGDLFDFPRLAELCERITEEAAERRAAAAGSAGPALRSRNVGGSGRPMFMVHGGGRLLAQLQDTLGPERPLHHLSAHWEDANIATDATIEELADEAMAHLLEIQPEGPYRLGGFSLGAVIIYEIALRLSALGQVVELLLLLDPPEDPGSFRSVPPECRDIGRGGGGSAARARHLDQLRQLRLLEAVRYAWSKLRGNFAYRWSQALMEAKHAYAVICRWLGYPVPPRLRKLYVFRRYLAAARLYDLKPINCSLMLYRARIGYFKKGVELWRRLALGGLTVEEFDCDHEHLQWNQDVVECWTKRFVAQVDAMDRESER